MTAKSSYLKPFYDECSLFFPSYSLLQPCVTVYFCFPCDDSFWSSKTLTKLGSLLSCLVLGCIYSSSWLPVLPHCSLSPYSSHTHSPLSPPLSPPLSLSRRPATQECAPTFTIRTLWLARRRNTAGCERTSSAPTLRRTWTAGYGPWIRPHACSRATRSKGLLSPPSTRRLSSGRSSSVTLFQEFGLN